jgi:hypothetical protein
VFYQEGTPSSTQHKGELKRGHAADVPSAGEDACLLFPLCTPSISVEEEDVFYQGGTTSFSQNKWDIERDKADDVFSVQENAKTKRRKTDTTRKDDNEDSSPSLSTCLSPTKLKPIVALAERLRVTYVEAAQILLLNATQYIDVTYESPEEVDLKHQTPTKASHIGFLREQGVSSPHIRTEMHRFKKLNRHSIRDLTNYPLNPALPGTPSARAVMGSRVKLIEEKQRGNLTSFPPLAFVEPVEPETPEQRLERKVRQKLEFRAQFLAKEAAALLKWDPTQLSENMAQLVGEKHRAELSLILTPFQGYFDYLEARKTRYLEYTSQKSQGAKVQKLRWPDVVGAFNEFVAPSMTRLEIAGYEVYFILSTIDFQRTHAATGLLNHEAMKDGYSPAGLDGNPMNLHHVTQLDLHVHHVQVDDETRKAQEGPFKLVLIPACIHTEHSGSLHFDSETYVLPQKEINRTEFGKSRAIIMQKIVELFYKG